MAAGLVVPISGPAVGTWHSLPLGTLSDDGYELSCTVQGQEVNETDAYGMTLVEAIYRGQNWRCRIRGLEWDKTGLLGLLQMFGQTSLTARSLTPYLTTTTGAPIGDRWTKFCQILVITAILSDPPTFPAVITALTAGLAPQQQTPWNITSKVREMPFELVLIPYATTSGGVAYSVPFTTS